LKDLRQITILGLGLLGGSIGLAALRSFPGMRVIGHTHRARTRAKARQLGVATEIVDDIAKSVSGSDIVILATPISTFERILSETAGALPGGCIVTDVGSTKVWPHRCAARTLPKNVYYVGSHPIAGSEQRGVEFARDDLFDRALCILTTTKKTNRQAVQVLKNFWAKLGCFVKLMGPAEHDRIFAYVSHLPHITAASLINANATRELKFAGKGFIDTSRIASGPENIWADVLMTNASNVARGIDRITKELAGIRRAITSKDKKQIEAILKAARRKRAALIDYKMKRRELIP